MACGGRSVLATVLTCWLAGRFGVKYIFLASVIGFTIASALCGAATSLSQLVFSPNSDELAAATQFLVQGALQQWLDDLIQVEEVLVENRDSALHVAVQYVNRRTQQREIARFARGGTSA